MLLLSRSFSNLWIPPVNSSGNRAFINLSEMKRKSTGEGDGEAESSIVGKKGRWQEFDKVST